MVMFPGRSWETGVILFHHLTSDPIPYLTPTPVISLLSSLVKNSCHKDTSDGSDVSKTNLSRRLCCGAAQLSGAGVLPGVTGAFTYCVGGEFGKNADPQQVFGFLVSQTVVALFVAALICS